MIDKLRKDLENLASPKKAKILQRFFKTGKGQYGEGDIFLGIAVPQSRKIAQKYGELSLPEIKKLLESKIHEERWIALLILVQSFKKGNPKKKKQTFDFYLKNTKFINNWDLVDLSADKIVGAYLKDGDKNILLRLAKSKSIWEKRIAIISTFYYIRFQKNADWTFKIAKILLNDSHDLIHKAVGWMLREAGKNISQKVEEEFLKKYYKSMPRIMLRYAIEKFEETKRKAYLKKF